MTHPARLVEVVRSGFVESVHRGSVAVVDAGGSVLGHAGDHEGRVNLRSCSKPLQAAVSLACIGDEVSGPEIAVMAASHVGAAEHVKEVERLLSRSGLGAQALRCPPALPSDPEAARRAQGPDRRYMNCSGKHAGMLLACVRQGWDPAAYPEPDHPLQRRILDAVREATAEEPGIGVDGCGIPVHAVSLTAVARMYAGLGRPATALVAAEMREHPELVEGNGRIDTEAMRAVPNLVVKTGAEGLLSAALLERGIGVAVKVDDGGTRAAAPALLAVLAQLGELPDAAREALAAFLEPPVRGGESRAGSLRAVVELAR